METKTYLIKHSYNYDTKSITNISGSTITIQFKIMDNLTVLEIVGMLKGQSNEEFKHQIICHKDQHLTILPNVNDQIEQVDNLESVYKDRTYIINSYSQFNEDVFVDQRVIFNTKHLIRDTFNTTVLNELQELIVDVLANRADSQKEEKQVDLEDLIREQN